ncbi:MAG: hypothetical protein JO202_17780 [Ktedonobacteraceae bacterium]|nr:hypothetical protein [Ktedonobacteraceae bacterium]
MTISQSTSQQILIVTQAFDPHADELIVLLRYLEQEPLRLNTEVIPADSLLSYTFSSGKHSAMSSPSLSSGPTVADQPIEPLEHYTLLVDGRLIDARRVGAVWWRRPAPYQFVGTLQPEEYRFAVAETEQAMHSFWLALMAQGCYWMSAPPILALARNLPEQLRRAHHYGFALPRSLVTTRSGKVRALYQETGGQVVYRVLSGLTSATEDGHVEPPATSAILTQDHLAALDAMVSVPGLFQERLPAQRLYTVVVLGDQIFTAQTTQTLEQVPHWWSPQTYELMYEPVSLSPALTARCQTFVQSYGLEFAVMQLAIGPQEQIFFVALDPVGPFLWLEQQCPDLRLCEALAMRLVWGLSR